MHNKCIILSIRLNAILENMRRFVNISSHTYIIRICIHIDTRIICVDMEIGKFEYCNSLHNPVMSLVRYLDTYLSFIMYSKSVSLLGRFQITASYQFRKHAFESVILIHSITYYARNKF